MGWWGRISWSYKLQVINWGAAASPVYTNRTFKIATRQNLLEGGDLYTVWRCFMLLRVPLQSSVEHTWSRLHLTKYLCICKLDPASTYTSTTLHLTCNDDDLIIDYIEHKSLLYRDHAQVHCALVAETREARHLRQSEGCHGCRAHLINELVKTDRQSVIFITSFCIWKK